MELLGLLGILLAPGLLPVCSGSWEDVSCCSQDGAVPVCHQHALLGSPEVVLTCPASQATSKVEWRVNGTAVANGTEGGHLVLRNASLADDREYVCRDKATGRILRRVRLKLGYPPDKPVVQCGAVSYVAIHCSWQVEAETHLATSFLPTYRFGMDGELYNCTPPVPTDNSCSITNVQMFSTDPYVLNVTAMNPLGTATTLSFIFLDQIIKPDPPENVAVSPIKKEKKKVHLTWEPPSSWLLPEYFPLKYSIRFSMGGYNISKRVSRTTEETSFILTGLRPGVIYRIQVAAKDALDNGMESDWSLPAFGTAWGSE